MAITVRWRMGISFKFEITDDLEVPIGTYLQAGLLDQYRVGIRL